MAFINKERLTAEIEGDFVVFMIGMRVNNPLKVHKWLPVFMAMPPMLRELSRNPELGMLDARTYLANPFSPMVIQYWRSFEQLEAWATNRDRAHLPAWAAFNKRIASNGDVGIWHETFKVVAGQYETVYNNMPIFGLARASRPVPATGTLTTAHGRMTGEAVEPAVEPGGQEAVSEPADG